MKKIIEKYNFDEFNKKIKGRNLVEVKLPNNVKISDQTQKLLNNFAQDIANQTLNQYLDKTITGELFKNNDNNFYQNNNSEKMKDKEILVLVAISTALVCICFGMFMFLYFG